MAAITGNVKATLNVTQFIASGFLAGTGLSVEDSLGLVLRQSGTLADQCDLCHAKTYSFTASTGQTIDLTTVTDILGTTTAFARIRALFVKVKSTTDAATLTVGNAASTAWSAALGATGTIVLRGSTSSNSGGLLLLAPNTTGYVVDASHKSLLMTPSAHAFDVDLVVLGCSA